MREARDGVIAVARTERVFLTWTIHHSCNYRCSYCFVTTGYRDVFLDNTYPGLEKWIAVWDRVYDLYGSCIIKLAGGEPFTYPDFMELSTRLAQRHFLDFSSNLYWDVDEFVLRVPPGSARIEPSFHPEFCPDRADFARKCLVLKEHGFMGSVHMVGYPPLIDAVLEAKAYFESRGLNGVILPFRGRCAGRDYPDAYSEEEKLKLKMAISGRAAQAEGAKPSPSPTAPPAAGAATEVLPSEEEPGLDPEEKARRHIQKVNARYFDWYVKKGNHLDEGERWCLQGAYYGKIQPNGDVLRCCTPTTPEKRKELVVGNVLDPAFRLLEGAKACDISPCFCWKPMLFGQEERWKPLWRFETYGRPDKKEAAAG